jgi:putative nucleotidyltransferase with HDIG domain
LEEDLREHVRREEATLDRNGKGPDTLWDHLSRVAAIAERLGRAEGLDPQICRIAGLFHDAGKFHGGELHGDDVPEEQHSVEVLGEIAGRYGIPKRQVDAISDAILQLYRDDPEPTPLAMVLFDADNLDKLGPLGIANYFVKRGLRGRGISSSLVYRCTVELTYARHAPACMMTETGRRWAARRAPETERFLRSLLDQMHEDGLAEVTVEEVEFDGLLLIVAASAACACGGALDRKIWQVPGLKCSEIHLSHTCGACGERHEVKFCRPRLQSGP